MARRYAPHRLRWIYVHVQMDLQSAQFWWPARQMWHSWPRRCAPSWPSA